jgi:hypothetical protein
MSCNTAICVAKTRRSVEEPRDRKDPSSGTLTDAGGSDVGCEVGVGVGSRRRHGSGAVVNVTTIEPARPAQIWCHTHMRRSPRLSVNE